MIVMPVVGFDQVEMLVNEGESGLVAVADSGVERSPSSLPILEVLEHLHAKSLLHVQDAGRPFVESLPMLGRAGLANFIDEFLVLQSTPHLLVFFVVTTVAAARSAVVIVVEDVVCLDLVDFHLLGAGISARSSRCASSASSATSSGRAQQRHRRNSSCGVLVLEAEGILPNPAALLVEKNCLGSATDVVVVRPAVAQGDGDLSVPSRNIQAILPLLSLLLLLLILIAMAILQAAVLRSSMGLLPLVLIMVAAGLGLLAGVERFCAAILGAKVLIRGGCGGG